MSSWRKRPVSSLKRRAPMSMPVAFCPSDAVPESSRLPENR